MYTRIYTHTNIYTHACKHALTHVHTYACTQTCTRACMHMHTHMHMHAHTHTRTHRMRSQLVRLVTLPVRTLLLLSCFPSLPPQRPLGGVVLLDCLAWETFQSGTVPFCLDGESPSALLWLSAPRAPPSSPRLSRSALECVACASCHWACLGAGAPVLLSPSTFAFPKGREATSRGGSHQHPSCL